jgi:membrane protein DedA with SNARE-associated domain
VSSLAERLLDNIAELGPVVLHLVAVFLAFSETALFLDLLVPGEAGMVVAGAAAARAGASLPTMIVAASAGAILGDTVSYLIGRRYGMRLIQRWGPIRRRLEPRAERARAFFDRHGGAAVFIGRWVGVVRGVIPAVAGMAEMPYRRFLAWNVLASVTWVGAVISAGYLMGRNIDVVVSKVGLAITLVVVVSVAAWWWYRRRHRAPHAEVTGSPAPR